MIIFIYLTNLESIFLCHNTHCKWLNLKYVYFDKFLSRNTGFNARNDNKNVFNMNSTHRFLAFKDVLNLLNGKLLMGQFDNLNEYMQEKTIKVEKEYIICNALYLHLICTHLFWLEVRQRRRNKKHQSTEYLKCIIHNSYYIWESFLVKLIFFFLV